MHNRDKVMVKLRLCIASTLVLERGQRESDAGGTRLETIAYVCRRTP